MTDLLHNERGNDDTALSLAEADVAHLLHPTTNLAAHHRDGPVVHRRAEGVYLWDDAGKQYLEGMAGLWCTAIGYGEAELARVAEEQMRKLSYSQLFAGRTNEPSVRLAEKLSQMAGHLDLTRTFFGLSGSDANDTQIKLMWYYNNAIGKPQKKKIISRSRGYHGVTIGSGSLTGLPPYHAAFDLPISGVLHTGAPSYYHNSRMGESEAEFVARRLVELEAMIEQEGADTIAAFIAEPVQGAGGVIVPPAGYFEGVQKLLQQHDILFIDDEVICGFGRTGQAFGADTFDLQPTTMSLAKALSSAYLPISAVMVPEFLHEAFCDVSGELGNFSHGFTYSGHPVCAAVALRNLELMEERDLFAHVARVSPAFQERLHAFADHPMVGNVRGTGLIGAVEFAQKPESGTVRQAAEQKAFPAELGVAARCAAECAERGLILRNLGDVIAFCPPLVITDAQIDELFSKFSAALDATYVAIRAEQ